MSRAVHFFCFWQLTYKQMHFMARIIKIQHTLKAHIYFKIITLNNHVIDLNIYYAYVIQSASCLLYKKYFL